MSLDNRNLREHTRRRMCRDQATLEEHSLGILNSKHHGFFLSNGPQWKKAAVVTFRAYGNGIDTDSVRSGHDPRRYKRVKPIRQWYESFQLCRLVISFSSQGLDSLKPSSSWPFTCSQPFPCILFSSIELPPPYPYPFHMPIPPS